MSYCELNMELSKEDVDLKTEASRFAREVMRPISIELDGMAPDDVTAPGSPYWDFMQKAYALDYHKLPFPEKFGGPGLTPLQVAIVMEELAWGSFGLTHALNTSLDALMAMQGSEEQIQEFTIPYCRCGDGTYVGCWAVSDADGGQCTARLDSDEWVIRGRKSEWVSAGTIAKSVLLTCQIDPAAGYEGNGMFVFSLDRPGISRGKPLDKAGLRDLNHGSLVFDDVRVPKESLIVGPESYDATLEAHLCLILPMAGIWATGLARAGFEEAVSYARKRVQGGKRLMEHKSVEQKLFNMFRKVESSRQLCRAAFVHGWSNPPEKRLIEHAAAAKTYATQIALEVTSDVIQILGGIGITKDYVAEKLFRDARTSIACHGSNDTLSVSGGYRMLSTYRTNV